MISEAQELNAAAIPIRNIWLLMLYASSLYRERAFHGMGIEEMPDEIHDLVAELLTHAVARRLKRKLSCGYQKREEVLSRIRGRVDHIATERHQLLERGKVACRFEELTINTVNNRYVRVALERMAVRVNSPLLRIRCRSLCATMKRMGVLGESPSRQELRLLSDGQPGSNDRLMLFAARLAHDLALPLESEGGCWLAHPGRDNVWLRKLYERAVGGFYEVSLEPLGWRVTAGKSLRWQVDNCTSNAMAILPSMVTDIVLHHPVSCRTIVIDTKFNEVIKGGWYREETIRSAYLYQIYAYLRSQERVSEPSTLTSEGMLLHPALGSMMDETVWIQGHPIRFATVDLAGSAQSIRHRLLQLVE